MKLWGENTKIDKKVELFTIGADQKIDLYLAKSDIIGSIAHIKMLEKVGLLTYFELKALSTELKILYKKAETKQFFIEKGIEDIHSQVEWTLTKKLGDIGKKIHSGRSRNDQVLLDIKLFIRESIQALTKEISNLIDLLLLQSNRYKDVFLPGYTHLQIAMPSSFGLWFGAYAESLVDDLLLLQTAYKLCNRNPLGSAAGYGSSFPIDRQMTTDLLGFDSMNYNVVYAQMGRGKIEKIVSFALSGIASTISKLSMDTCLYNSQNFNFFTLPNQFTTGSSIMPHKKNPDAIELIRAKCNKIQAVPQQITSIVNNLPSGYFRDLQIVKELFLPVFDELSSCIHMAYHVIKKITIHKNLIDNDKYSFLFSVERVNELVLKGSPFREAYKQVKQEIESGIFFYPKKKIHHTHEGSIGNLCNNKIKEMKKNILKGFHFEKVDIAIYKLLNSC